MKHQIFKTEYTEQYGDGPVTEKVALYDRRDFAPEEVDKVIREHAREAYHPKMLFLTKRQYESVFRSLIGVK